MFQDLGLNLVDPHGIRKINLQIIYYNITSIPAERIVFSADFGHWVYFGLSSNPW